MSECVAAPPGIACAEVQKDSDLMRLGALRPWLVVVACSEELFDPWELIKLETWEKKIPLPQKIA